MKIFLIFFFVFIVVQLTNYITFHLNIIDDCLRELKIGDDVLFSFTPLFFGVCELFWIYRPHCDSGNTSMYPPGLDIIKDYEYNFKTDIKVTFEDYNHQYGYMNMTVFFNEYVIKNTDRRFWRCINCGYDGLGNNDYYYYLDRMNFYSITRGGDCSEELYIFYFTINDITDLYKGGADGPFEIRTDFYSFTNEDLIRKEVNFSEKIELELINFNIPENLHVKENHNLPINTSNYYFIIEYEKNEGNNFGGELKGLDLNGTEKTLNNNDKFIVNDFSGLNYILSEQEKVNRFAQVKVKISVLNKCPDGNEYQCESKVVVPAKYFTFIINVNEPPPTTTPITEKNSTIPETETPADTTQQTTTPVDTTQQTTIPADTTPADTTQQTTTPAETTQQTTTPVETTQQTTTPPETTQQTTTPAETTQQTTTPSVSDTSENISQDTSKKISDYISSDISEEIYHCLKYSYSHDKQNDFYSHLCLNYSKDNILDDLDDMVKLIDKNKNYKIIGKDFIAQVFPIDYLNGKSTNNADIFSTSYTNFTECEKILRESNEYYSPKKITFVQVELNNSNNDILVNQIEYKVYDDKNNSLNLSLCENATIKTYYNIKNDTKDEVDLISFFNKKGIDILDLNDNFFNDVCLPYSDLKNDLTLNDRIKDIYKNYIFCEKNCKLIEIKYEEYKVVCDCSIKENINATDFNFNLTKTQIEKKNNNFKIIKCHNAFSSLKEDLSNIGFWLFLGLMLLNIILLFLYIYGLKTIQNYITREMVNHGYIGKSDENHIFCHNYIKKLDKLILRLKNLKNDLAKKGVAAPPKHKTKTINLSDKSERNEFKNRNKVKSKNNKVSLERDIKLLKSRMNKTRKVQKNNSDDINQLYGSKIKINTQVDLNNGNEQNNFKLNLININVNDVKKKTYIPNLSEQILNIYNFLEALKYDNRNFFTIYYIFLIAKQVIMHAIFYKSPIEPLPIRLSLLKFMLGCDLALNAIFYTDDKISEKYNSTKNAITFAFTNNLIVILLSTLIGYVMFIFLGNLNNSTNQIRNLFREEEEKIKNNKNYKVSLQRKKEIICEVKRIMRNYKIKIIIFYIMEFVCMIFFWYYVTIFCNIYKKTQLSWIIDCLITIIIRIIVDFFINLILALLYRSSISLKSNCLFKVIIFFYCFSC